MLTAIRSARLICLISTAEVISASGQAHAVDMATSVVTLNRSLCLRRPDDRAERRRRA
jgi:hypothetical protein